MIEFMCYLCRFILAELCCFFMVIEFQMDVPKLPELCCFFMEYRFVLTIFMHSFMQWDVYALHIAVCSFM
jgi:hypothetical protein